MEASTYQTVIIGKAKIACISFKQAVESIIGMTKSRSSHYIVTPNTDHIVQLESDNDLLDAYNQASLVVCDGKPVYWASHVLGTPIPEVVTGADLLPELCKHGAQLNLKVAIIGGPPGSADLAGRNLRELYPGIQILWTYCPPMGFEKSIQESQTITAQLNALDLDLVFIGVGAPKQEKWIYNHRSQLRVGALLGIGAAIEFTAGTLNRAPKLMRKMGLEWLFRLTQDPKRLFWRYLRDVSFLKIVISQMLRRRCSPKNA